jgi:hypothetical protein
MRSGLPDEYCGFSRQIDPESPVHKLLEMHFGIFLSGGQYSRAVIDENIRGKLMRLNNKILFFAILIIFFGGIGTAKALDVWESKPAVVAKNQSATEPGSEAAVSTAADPGYIRGTNSFTEISQTYSIPLNDLKSAFAPDSGDKFPDMKAKDIKSIYAKLGEDIAVETESVRIFAAMYTSVKYFYSNQAYMPDTAVKILKEKVKLSPEQLSWLESHMVKLP